MAESLYVHEIGPQDAPTIVFLHGGGVGGWMWQPQIDALKNEFHCLVPDLPEHGRSLDVKPLTMDDTTRRVIDLIEKRAHGGRAHLVGLSFGAQVGVSVLSRASHLIQRAILSSPLMQPLPLAWMYSPALLRWSVRWFVAPFKRSQWYARLNMKYSAGIPEAYFPPFFEDYQNITPDSFTNLMVANMNFRQPAGLEKVNVPTLVIAGKSEYQAMQESVRQLVRTMPEARGVVVSLNQGAAQDHNWSLNAPDLFTETVRAWLNQQPLPAALQPL